MDLLNQILKKIFNQNPELRKGLHEARILELWPKAVGETIARHAKAVQIKGSTLFVTVEQPVWRQELHSNKMLALKKLNELLLQELGPPGNREIWVQELFLVGGGGNAGAKTSPTRKSGRGYTKK